ncbi:uncharacterized protein LOC116105663 isoform X3 [Pistacia vera]|uniref:uncharacterized protein LOC116105663 isoform X3 n=1 Tax=Pistacia vera TaxID=55513 RepID=UPI001262C72A|nr:uncharacterized protein LOC116105663 isoform X3 [Pistacia vera]
MPLRPQVTNLSFTNQHFDVTGDMLILSYQMILFCLEVLNLKVGFGACSAEQEGIKVNPIELSQFLDFIKQNKLRTHSFIIGPNQCMMAQLARHLVLCCLLINLYGNWVEEIFNLIFHNAVGSPWGIPFG